jgi:hypothetical protein
MNLSRAHAASFSAKEAPELKTAINDSSSFAGAAGRDCRPTNARNVIAQRKVTWFFILKNLCSAQGKSVQNRCRQARDGILGKLPNNVAQIFNLPYRRFVIGKANKAG